MAGSTFASRSYRDVAVVLRTHDLGEADRIITVLTEAHGLVRAVAKGVRRTTSKFGATVEPFMVADVQFVHGRTLDLVTQAVSRGSYGTLIVADYEKYTAAHVMVETAERLTEAADQELRSQFRLLHGALSALARSVHPPDLVLNSYLLRALSTAGWAVTWTACVACGLPGAQSGFHEGLGGPVCPDCRPPGTRTVTADVLGLLNALQHGAWQSARSADQEARHEASSLVSTYVQHHLERRLSSLGR